MKYRYEYMNQGQLGDLFGETSHVVGRWLKELGLRNKQGSPSGEAFEKKLVSQNYDSNGTYSYVWHVERTVAELEAAGHKQVAVPPTTLVEPPVLKGPFTMRASNHDNWHLVGSDNEVAIAVTGEANAKVVAHLLNLAHRCRIVEPLLSILN